MLSYKCRTVKRPGMDVLELYAFVPSTEIGPRRVKYNQNKITWAFLTELGEAIFIKELPLQISGKTESSHVAYLSCLSVHSLVIHPKGRQLEALMLHDDKQKEIVQTHSTCISCSIHRPCIHLHQI